MSNKPSLKPNCINIKIPAKLIPAIATANLNGCLVNNNQANGIFLNLKKEKLIREKILQSLSFLHSFEHY